MKNKDNIRELSQGRADLWKISPSIIKIKPGWNARDDTPELQEHIETIARSILSRGYDTTKPLTVWKDEAGYTLSDGHCRLRATLLAIKWGADIKAVPVVCEPQATNEADRVLGMLTRNSGMNLTPLEQGKVYKRLMGFGWDAKQIVEATGKSKTHVEQIFALMEATPETHQQVVNGKVSAGAVADAVRAHGPARAAKAVERAVESAKVNGKAKATARDVRAASAGEDATKPRPLSEIVEFFRTTVAEQDGPPAVQKIAEAFLAYREGRTTAEKFMGQLSGIVKGAAA